MMFQMCQIFKHLVGIKKAVQDRTANQKPIKIQLFNTKRDSLQLQEAKFAFC